MNNRHPFERTIGPGPYKFIGIGKIHVSETFGARYIGPECERGCGTCAHCGTGIMNIFVIRAGDGKNYGVGCDCILKSNLPLSIITEAQKAERERKKAMRAEKKEKKRAMATLLRDEEIMLFKTLWENSTRCKASWRKQPHPNKYLAEEKGLSLFDYITWNLEQKNSKVIRRYVEYLRMEADGDLGKKEMA